MAKRLVLIGGGHAHMVTLARLAHLTAKGHQVTVIGPSDHHYYSGMGPGMLAGTYRPEQIRFATRQVVEQQGGRFIRDRALRIDPREKRVWLESGTSIPYDVLSCNTGSHVPLPVIAGEPPDLFTVKPIEGLLVARERLVDHFRRHPLQVAIVGGGPSAAEVAGNVRHLADATGGHRPRITICAGARLMGRFPPSLRRAVVNRLAAAEVEIREGAYVQRISPQGLFFDNGAHLPAPFIFLALGVRPSPLFAASDIPTGPDGGLRVNRFLQSVAHPDLFGGGDCIYFEPRPLDKVGVYAVRQNPVLFHNLVARLEDRDPIPFDPGGDYLLIFNLGGGIGVLKKRWLTFGGRAAFAIKDLIDRRFMKKYQALEREHR